MPSRSHRAIPLALAFLAVTALAVSCSKDNSTAPMTIAGPNFSFTFPSAGASHEEAFPDAGSFGYQCLTHGSSMSGTVNVQTGGQDSIVVTVGANGGVAANVFSPATVTIKPGGKVRWVLANNALTNHTATR
jgi:plastocyanin